MGTLQGPLPVGILLFILTASSFAHPQCNLGCSGSPGSLFKYEPGTNYKYKLEGSTETKLAGSTQNVAKLGLSAIADISALPNCVYVLQLSDVHLTGPDGKTYPGGDEFKSKPIKFSMNNGKVESEICTGTHEYFTSLNVKRAVISLLQSVATKESGTTTLRETDLFGTCPTTFDFSQSGNTLTIRKNRDLNLCAYREDISVPFLSTPYYVKSDIQSLPLMEASMKVEQQVVSGVVKSAKGEEHYVYRPTQHQESGAKVFVHTKLTLVSQSKGAPLPAAVTVKKSIIFNLPHQGEGISNADTILSALKLACESMEPFVKESGARDFNALVRSLAQAKKADILNVYAQVKSGAGFKNKNTAWRALMDGIVRAESADSAEAMAELLKNKEVTGIEAKVWLLSLGMVRHASRSTLKSLMPLLKGEPSVEAYLGVGALAGKFVRHHGGQGVLELEQLEAKIAAPLFAGCKPPNLDAEDHLIASMKGLGSIHYLSPEVVTKLSQCAADKSARTRVRNAALETILTDPKKDQFKAVASTILKNFEEDAELRIKAYLVMAKTPCGKTAALIKEVLDNEKVYQVGSFIVSHLRNIRSSTNPDKADAKHHFRNIKTNKNFPFDFRKFSLNHELSYSFDSVNVGASAESNVIYSQKSYVPRSLSLNLTTQLFGHSFNWLELNARAENLDHVLEKWFGPRGYLKSKDSNQVVEEGSSAISSLYQKIMNKYKETVRPKRSASRAQLEELEKKVHLGQEINDEVVDVDVSMKVYGSEAGWYNYHSSDPEYEVDSVLDTVFGKLDSSINRAKNIDFDLKKHFTFIDGTVAYPTGLGLALRLKTVGSGALRLKVDGKIDIPGILKDPKNTDIKFQLIPSAAIELIGTLSVDGDVVESGVKICLNMHTATGSDLTLRVLDGNGIDLKFGLPVEKQDLITVTTDALSVVKEKGSPEVDTPIQFNTKRQEYEGCFDQLSELTGLTFCGVMKMPWEGQKILLPSYGPSKFSLSVLKDDQALTSYHCKIYFKQKLETGQTKFEILFDTPNTSVQRKLNLVVDYGLKPKTYLKVDVVSPWYTSAFDGYIVNSKKEMTLNAKLANPEGQDYSLKVGALISGGGKSFKYEPVLEYKSPEPAGRKLVGRKGAQPAQQAFYLTGTIDVEQQNSPCTDTKSCGDTTYTLNDLTFHISQSEYKMNGKILRGDELITADLKVDYDKEHVLIKGKIDSHEENKLHHFLEVLPSQYPDLGFSITWDFDYIEDEAELHEGVKSNLVIVHGPDPKSEDARVTLYNYFEQKSDKFGLKTENHVTYPILEIEGKFDIELSGKGVNHASKAKFDKYLAETTFVVEFGVQHDYDYNIDFMGKLMENSVHLASKHVVLGDEKSKFASSLEFHPGSKYEHHALVVHNFDDDDFKLHVDSELKIPMKPNVIKLIFGVKHNENICSGELKVLAGPDVLIDTEAVYNSNPSPSGHYNFNLPEYCTSNGEFTFNNNNLKGNAKLMIPKVNREMNGVIELQVADPNYSGFVDFCWDTSNPKKSLKIETNSVFADESFDTKNTINFKEYTTQLNVKGEMTGTWTDGTVTGETEMVLPDTRHMIGKFSRSLHMETSGTFDGEWIVEFVDHVTQGANPTKINLKAVGKNINLENGQFDGQASLVFVNPENQDAHLNANFKKVPSGETKWTINGEVAVTGSLMEQPVNFKLESEVDENLLKGVMEDGKCPPYSFHLTSSIGSDISLDCNGKGSGNTFSGEVAAKLPQTSTVHNFKWTVTNFIDILPREGAQRKVKTNNALSWNDDQFLKVNAEVCEEDHGGNFKFDWESNKDSKRSLTGSAHFKKTNGEEPCKSDVALVFAWEDKTADVTVKTEVAPKRDSMMLHISGQSPEMGKFDLLTKGKAVKDGKGIHADAAITTMEKKITATAKIEIVEDHPLIDIVIDHPDGKSKFFLKMDKKGPKHFTTETKAKWTANGGGSWISDGEVNYGSMDNFIYKVNVDSQTMNINKFHLDISSRPSAGKSPGKKIMISAKLADEVILSGSTTYKVEESGDIKSVEGSGNVKYKDETHPLTFKFTSKPYTTGKQFSMEAKAGKHSFNLDMKRTPTEFSVERVYCKEPKVCSKAQILSKTEELSVLQYDHKLVVLLDFSLYNPELHDFKLTSSSKRNGIVMDNKFMVQWSDDGKLEYNSFVHEDQTGFSLTLPHRTIAGELNFDWPTEAKLGKSKLEASLWLDKVRSPNKRTHFVVQSDAKKVKDTLTLSGETTFSHPALSKELCVKGKVTMNDQWAKPLMDGHAEIDIFTDPSQIININMKVTRIKEKGGYSANSLLSIKSDGCHLDLVFEQKGVVTKSNINYIEKFSYVDSTGAKKEATAKLELTPQKLFVLVKLPSLTVLEVNCKMEKKPNQVYVTATTEIVGSKYKETLTLTNTPHMKYQLVLSKAGGEKALDVNAGIEKDASLSVMFDNANVVDFHIDLSDEDFLKSKYNYDTDNVRKLYKTVAEDVTHLSKQYEKGLKATFEKGTTEINFVIEKLQGALPDFSPMMEAYTQQLQAIKNEIASDKAINSMADYLKKPLNDVIEHLVIVLEELSEFSASMITLLKEGSEKILTAIKESLPTLQKSVQRIAQLCVYIMEEWLKFSIQVLDIFLAQIKEHDEDIKIVTEALASYIHEIGKICSSVVKEFYVQLKDFYEVGVEQLRQLPVVEVLKEKWDELKTYEVPEEILNVYTEVVDSLKQLLPTEELGQLITTCSSYFLKLVKREPIDGTEAVKQIYQDLISAVKSLFVFIASKAPEQGLQAGQFFTFPTLTALRFPSGALRVSLIKWLFSWDTPTIDEIFSTYFLPSLNPIDHIPPFQSSGVLLGGSEVITFDGRHFSFKGTCSYVMAEDYAHGNFCVVANVENGKLHSITLYDDQDSIEIRHKQSALVNGQPSEFPIKKGHLKAWRRPHSVGMWSNAGVLIICGEDATSCLFRISGFYFNKVRGLLGNPNYEPYDDITLPEGKVAENSVAFGNSWKVDPSCADVPGTGAHTHNRESQCTAFFTEEDDLELCYLTLDPKPYRDACDHLVATAATPEAKKAAACSVVTSYASMCREQGNFLAEIPDTCVTCTMGKEKVDHGKSITVTTPGKSADVIFVVEQLKKNEQLFKAMVPPLVASLSNDFKQKGISDVQFGLVGFGDPKNKWPNYFTTDGDIVYKGKASNLVFYDAPEQPNVTFIDKFRLAVDTLNKELGNTPRSGVYWDIGESFKFRPHSVKTIIAVHANPCEHGKFIISLGLLKTALGFGLYKYGGINVNYVVPGTVELKGHESKCVVGYSDDHIFTLDDAKQTPLKGMKFDDDDVEEEFDLCTSLTSSFGGNVFSGGNFLNEKPPQRKQFLGVMSQRIVESLTDHKETYECNCEKYHGVMPRSTCELEDVDGAIADVTRSSAVKTRKGTKG